MRVALVSGYDASVPGGVQGQVAALAAALSAGGDTVAVVAPLRGDSPFAEIAGAELIGAGRGFDIAVNGSVAPVAPTPHAVARALAGLRSFRPDVVHVHEPLLPGPPLGCVLLGPPPVVGTFHRADADPLYRTAGRLLGPLVARRLAVATAVSKAASDTATAVLSGLGPVRIVSNGASLGRLVAARRSFVSSGDGPFKGGGRPRICFLGRLERRKGPDVLLSAVAQIKRDVDLVIVGDGPMGPELRDRAGPGVVFLGRLDDEAAARELARADLFVAPARSGESFGLVLIEAMASGTAVVASDIEGYASAAAGAARLVRPDDAAALAAGVLDLLEDDEERARLVALGEERASSCTIEATAAGYRECYELALSTARRRHSR